MSERQRVLIELDASAVDAALGAIQFHGFTQDSEYEPAKMSERTSVIRGWIHPGRIEDIRKIEGVVSVSEDSKIAPF